LENSSTNVVLEKISNRHIRKFLQTNSIKSTSDFSALHIEKKEYENFDGFFKHEKIFPFATSSDKLWDIYKKISPIELWNSSMLTMGLLYNAEEKKIIYVEDNPEVRFVEGLQMITLVTLLGGLINIAVGHEVTEINDAEKYLCTAYLGHGKCIGNQKIQILDIDHQRCLVRHTTYYKSDSFFRDKFLYPFFHTLAINKVHANIRRKLK